MKRVLINNNKEKKLFFKQILSWLGMRAINALVFSFFSILFILGIVYATINWPGGVPTGETSGGKFMAYFTNMLGDCPDGQALVGFTGAMVKNCKAVTPPIPQISLTISSDTANYNIAIAASNPSSQVDITLTINTGVTVYSLSPSLAALITGSLPAGSTVKIINHGNIYGAGGTGGAGGGGGGGNGGNALFINDNTIVVNIDNTSGNIYGGGGGGGGGSHSWGVNYAAGGGGGGGGQGRNGGSAGSAGIAPDPKPPYQDGGGGGAGSLSGPGGGGGGGDSGFYGSSSSGFSYGGAGGTGGSWGSNGTIGIDGTGGDGTRYTHIPGNGGLAGYAVRKNGATVTWIAGNNASQVKGIVN